MTAEELEALRSAVERCGILAANYDRCWGHHSDERGLVGEQIRRALSGEDASHVELEATVKLNVLAWAKKWLRTRVPAPQGGDDDPDDFGLTKSDYYGHWH